MSAGILLIDGYNLLHAAGMAQSDYRPGELLRCRTRLLTFLVNQLSPAEIRETTIVFDARDPPPDRPSQVVVSGLKILFANPGGDADILIQEWLARHPSPRRVRLVSSDRVLQRAARACGSKFIGSADFFQDLERRGRSTGQGRTVALANDAKPSLKTSPGETAYWMRIFGGITVAETDADDAPVAPAAPVAIPKAKREIATGRRPWRSPEPHSSDDSKPTRGTADELAYWMDVFGDQPSSGSTAASSHALRLADLESWLKKFEAEGELGPKTNK